MQFVFDDELSELLVGADVGCHHDLVVSVGAVDQILHTEKVIRRTAKHLWCNGTEDSEFAVIHLCDAVSKEVQLVDGRRVQSVIQQLRPCTAVEDANTSEAFLTTDHSRSLDDIPDLIFFGRQIQHGIKIAVAERILMRQLYG